MSFRLVSKSVTLNDLEWRNDPYFAFFCRIRVRCRRKQLLPRFQNLLLIVHTICAIIPRLFVQKRGGNSLLLPVVEYALSPDKFL